MKAVELFTDGACRGKPGPDGRGVLLRFNGSQKCLYGAEVHTANNRMALLAAIRGLQAVSETCQIALTSYFQYVRKGITRWLQGWKARGWKTAAKKPVKNKDLWQLLDQQAQRHQVNWHWVKGRSGHTENEIADELANFGIDDLLEKA